MILTYTILSSRPDSPRRRKSPKLSGRGVGMNVVKEIVSELNGNVSIETEWGMGTRFVLVLPHNPGDHPRHHGEGPE